MRGKSLRLATAAAFILGLGLFVVGTVIAFAVSWPVGYAIFVLAAALMGASRLVAWKFKLPAP